MGKIGKISLQNVKLYYSLSSSTKKLLHLFLYQKPKDYVDLYFILKEKSSIWDLLKIVKTKFKLDLDLISLGEDFLNSKELKFLPKMIKPLTLDELKSFFRLQAKKLGTKVI